MLGKNLMSRGREMKQTPSKGNFLQNISVFSHVVDSEQVCISSVQSKNGVSSWVLNFWVWLFCIFIESNYFIQQLHLINFSEMWQVTIIIWHFHKEILLFDQQQIVKKQQNSSYQNWMYTFSLWTDNLFLMLEEGGGIFYVLFVYLHEPNWFPLLNVLVMFCYGCYRYY